jgi:hypothetical protein
MKMTENENSKTQPPPKKDDWLSMKNDSKISSKHDDDNVDRYN